MSDAVDIPGIIGVLVLAAMSVAALFLGKRIQRSADVAEAARIRESMAKAEGASVAEDHEAAVDRLDAGGLREHNDSLADSILRGGSGS